MDAGQLGAFMQAILLASERQVSMQASMLLALQTRVCSLMCPQFHNSLADNTYEASLVHSKAAASTAADVQSLCAVLDGIGFMSLASAF
jgi:hypothetical protein